MRATAVDQIGVGALQGGRKGGKTGFNMRLAQVEEDLAGVWDGRADEVLQSPFSTGIYNGSLAPIHN